MKKREKIKFGYIFIMIAIFVYLLMLITHTIPFPTFAYKVYFKLHKDNFQSIADYAESTNQSVYCYDDFNGELHKSSITDSKTEKSICKIYNSIMFHDIHGNVYDSDNYNGTRVDFDIDSFISFNGIPYKICYSCEKPLDDYNYFSHYYEIVKYEKISDEDNWYIAFRYVKQGSVG